MKKTITFLSRRAAVMLLATLLLTLTAQTAWAAEYEIYTLEELREFMEAVHVEDFAGDVIRLMADIDCERGRFNTGDPEYPSTFRGTFDGQGYKIYNFVHGPTGSGQEGYGTAMFDFAETGAAIQNLTLEGSLPGDKYCGAYAAAFVLAVESPLGLLLDNCHFNGSVTNVYHSAALVGFASSGTGIGEVPSIILNNCSANANITTTSNNIAGGLVAKGMGVKAYDCSFKGKVTSLGTVGGLIGVAINCELENCFEGGYTYIDENSNNVYSTDYTVLDNTMTTISAGWYVVNSDVTFNGDLSTNADGEVHIILCDGATLTANNIAFNNHNYLYIYGQCQGTGTANISGRIEASSSLQIYGGTINAAGNIVCPQSGVGIYGGNVTTAEINGYDGSLSLKGGTITAGSLIVDQGDITLGGATVKANSYNVKNGNVTILTGITYYDGTGASYTAGNLTSSQISDIEGKTLRTYDYRTVNYVAADGTTATADARPLDDTMTTLDAGWYVVNSNVTVNSRINLTGNTNLILGDNCTLDVKGIYIPQGSTLTIYAQSDGENAGRIVSKPTSGAGIGGISEDDNGNIVICGGIIEAMGAENCAAIGGGRNSSGGTIIINGGTITTYSRDGAGIGGGDEGDGGNITINGGTITSVKVNQGQGARIGGGCDGAPGTITINGGTITTVGGTGAGIGGGKGNGGNGTVTINGGVINASGDYGIGAGEGGTDVAITLDWTSSDDRITASTYCGTVTIADGKAFTDLTNTYLGTLTDAEKTTIANVELQPVTGVTLTKDGSGSLTASLDPSSEGEVSIPVAVEVDHVEVDRTYENNKASTVYLPFSIAASKVSGGKFHTFTGVNEATTPWTVTYNEVIGDIAANTPYIFLPNGDNGGKIVVNNTEKITVGTGIASTPQTSGDWAFIGTYERIKWTHDTTDPEYTAAREAEIGSVYGFSAVDNGTDHVGDFVKVGNNVFINPMRAYLKKGSASPARAMAPGAQTQQLPDKMKVVIISASGETTEIGTLDTRTGEITLDVWYSLDGRRLSGKPTTKGVYINNGKTVVVK